MVDVTAVATPSSRLRVALGHAPLALAILASARESWLFIEASSFTVRGRRYFALFDDAMISMRYAWNLQEGRGLVWNPGEYVEGFTNPLWVLTMASVLFVTSRLKAVLAMQILGAALHTAAAVLFSRLAARPFRAGPRPVVAVYQAVFFWLVASAYPLRFWSHMGMEVSALLLVSALAWTFALEPALPKRGPNARTTTVARIGVLCALAYLLRPDGVLVVVPPLALAVQRARAMRAAWAWAVLPLAFAATTSTALRVAYYGDWLPNTYRLKMGGFPLADRLENGLGFVGPYAEQVVVLAALGACACAVLRSWRAGALAASPLLLLAYQVWVGGDPWPSWRQLSPGYPVLLLLVAWGVAGAIALVRRRSPRARPLRVLAPLLAAGLLAIGMEPTRIAFADGSTLAYHVDWARTNVERARVLRKILRPSARIAVFWAGVTPYYDMRRHAIDLLGKSDRTVAGLAPDLSGAVSGSGMKTIPGHNKTSLTHSLIDREADYAEARTWGRDALSAGDNPTFRPVQFGGQVYWLRRGSPRIDWDAVERESDHHVQTEATPDVEPAFRPRRMRYRARVAH